MYLCIYRMEGGRQDYSTTGIYLSIYLCIYEESNTNATNTGDVYISYLSIYLSIYLIYIPIYLCQVIEDV
jgi:hypothetical protein